MKIDISKNPGYKIRRILEEIFPFESSNSFINKMDEAIYANQEFSKLSYCSSLNYLLRRLIITSDNIEKQYNSGSFPEGRYVQEIRYYLKNHVKFPNDYVEDIHAFLLDCVKERNTTLSQGKIKHVLDNGRSRNYSCYICGRQLIYDKKGYEPSDPALAEVEHIWPRSLGGSNELFNLEVACHSCNSCKSDNIDSSDFHYEKFILVSNENDDSFKREFRKEFKMASYLRGNGECSRCGRKAIHQHTMNLAKVERKEIWHFLNIATFCDQHNC